MGRAVGWASSLEGRAFKSRVLCRKPVTSVLRKVRLINIELIKNSAKETSVGL